MKTFQYKV